MVDLKVKKLDRRNRGYGMFEYYVNPRYSSFASIPVIGPKRHDVYHEVREWCWNTWGPSKELDEWSNAHTMNILNTPCQNEYWCWQNDSHARRIFLRTEKELIMMKLRWE